MNAALLSNASSPLKSLLYQTSSYDPFSYSVRANSPNFSRQRVKVQPNVAIGANSHGASLTFPIPRYGILESCTMKFRLKIPRNKDKQRYSNWMGAFLALSLIHI